MHGPLTGRTLEQWPLHHTNVAAALVAYPEARLYRIPLRTPVAIGMSLAHRHKLSRKGFTPPTFRRTMGEADPRLPERTNGLGVLVDGQARFFPMHTIGEPVEDEWQGRTLRVGLGELDGSPRATWLDDGTLPMQLLSRWYGFAYTYPQCTVYEG